MKVTLTPNGAIVEASDLGLLLDVAPQDVPIKMRNGEITSQSAQGEGDDAGRTRLTFWYDGKRVRLFCDATGEVVKTSRTLAPRRA